MIGEPKIDYREQRAYMGLRTIAPFKGMFAEVNKLLKELRLWVKASPVADQGPFFLRYHVIDMNGGMDIEVGFVVTTPLTGDGRVQPGWLPAGRYASLIYTRTGMAANKALIGWAKENGVVWDRWETPTGDAFGCRYEAYLTDYRLEPRKSNWQVELAIKLADE